jgi:CRP-like cAMP-binding protein
MTLVERPEELYGLIAHGRPRRQVPAGGVIFEAGAPGESMYIVVSGSVALKHGEHTVETLSAPGLFGELALIEDNPRALTAVAASDAELVEIPERHFWVLVHETPYFAQLVMSVMADRLRGQSSTGPASGAQSADAIAPD